MSSFQKDVLRSSLIKDGARSKNESKLDNLIDLHVCVVPLEHWLEKYHKARNTAVSESISAGFIRVSHSKSLHDIRGIITDQLGLDIIPERYIFLRSVGRCLAVVNHLQELQLTASDFVYPTAHSELLLLSSTLESEYLSTRIGLSKSLDNSMNGGNRISATAGSNPTRNFVDESNYVHFSNKSTLPPIQTPVNRPAEQTSVNRFLIQPFYDQPPVATQSSATSSLSSTGTRTDENEENHTESSDEDTIQTFESSPVNLADDSERENTPKNETDKERPRNPVKWADSCDACDVDSLRVRIQQRIEKEDERLEQESSPLNTPQYSNTYNEEKNDSQHSPILQTETENRKHVKDHNNNVKRQKNENELTHEDTETIKITEETKRTNNTIHIYHNGETDKKETTDKEKQAKDKAEKERKEKEKQMRDKAEKERKEKEKQAKDKAEKERKEKEIQMRDKAEKERKDNEKQAKDNEEKERMEKQARDKEAKERREKEKQSKDRKEKERRDKEKQMKDKDKDKEKQANNRQEKEKRDKELDDSKTSQVEELKRHLEMVKSERKSYQKSQEAVKKKQQEVLVEISEKEASDNNTWRRKFVTEKTRSSALEEEINKTKKLIETQYQKSIPLPNSKGVTRKNKDSNKIEAPSEKSNQRNMVLRLQNDIKDLTRRCEVIKKQLAEEMTMKAFALQELKNLRTNATKSKPTHNTSAIKQTIPT